MIHETGHYLNLLHTFEGDDADNDGLPDQCPTGSGDLVGDTDPLIRSGGWNYDSPNTLPMACTGSGTAGCPASSATNCCTGTAYGTLPTNHMDYTSAGCRTTFSAGQSTRMVAALNALRRGITTSVGSLPAPTFAVPAAACAVGTTDMNNNFGMGIRRVQLQSINYSTGHSNDDRRETAGNAYLDRWCVNTPLAPNTGYTMTVTVGTANPERVAAYIDYNNDGDFLDAGEAIGTSTSGTGARTVAFTTPNSGATWATPLRLRIISDFVGNTISSACYSPLYGQVEDYSVSISSPLPITLVSFTGKHAKGRTLLNWVTASETSNDYFDVERSWDGRNFEKIGRRTGHGTTFETQNYNFSDVEVSKYQQANVAYYRLRQVDTDGQFEYSSVIPVTLFRDSKEILAIYPNPTTDFVSVDLGSISENFTVEVFDLTGKQVSFQEGSPSEAQTIVVNISNLAKNIYVLRISTKDKILCSERIVKM